MPDEDSRNYPTSDAQVQPSAPTPALEATPQQNKVGSNPDSRSDSKKDKTVNLEEDIKRGERWLIGISATGVIINVIIALIYYGQLGQMRKATVAATSAAKTAHDTLIEIQKGSTDTHYLAVAAKAQADATKIIAQNAQRTFGLNRPSVVVQSVPTATNTISGAFAFHVELVNASSVRAENLTSDCDVFLNGDHIPGTYDRIPAKGTLGGNQRIAICFATINKSTFERVEVGTFQIFIRATYRGPAGRYQYCEKQQYYKNAFVSAGECDASKPFPQ